MSAVTEWLTVLEGEDEPTRQTCVAVANTLVPTYALTNINAVRDDVIRFMRLNPNEQHEARLRWVLQVHEDDERAIDTIHPDVLDGIDTISWDAVPEVLCLAAVAALHKDGPADAKEAWVANGDAARAYLSQALDIEPEHNLARVLVQQGNLLAPVSGGVA